MNGQELAEWLRGIADDPAPLRVLFPEVRERLRQAAELLSLPPGFIEVDAADLPRDTFLKLYGLGYEPQNFRSRQEAEAALRASTHQPEGCLPMKLSDMHTLRDLAKDRDYLIALRDSARSGRSMQIGSHHVAPSILAQIRSPIATAIDGEIKKVDDQIRALGVVVDDKND